MTDQPTPDAEARARLIAELRACAGAFVGRTMPLQWCADANVLVQEAAMMLAAEGWRDISTAKESDSPALLALEDGRVVKGWFAGDHRGWHDAGGFQLHPTHWMPLPSPPGADELSADRRM